MDEFEDGEDEVLESEDFTVGINSLKKEEGHWFEARPKKVATKPLDFGASILSTVTQNYRVLSYA